MTDTKPKPTRLEIAAMLMAGNTQPDLLVDKNYYYWLATCAQQLIDADEAFEKERDE